MGNDMIKAFVMDVDGTLTDGSICISDSGELFKKFHVRDGYGIKKILSQNGIVPIIITGRVSDIVTIRCRELGIKEIVQGADDKLVELELILSKYGILPSETAYIGDDLNDLNCIEKVGVSGCPQDAVPKVKASVTYVCDSNGGHGAVREFIDWIVSGN